jgi:hypothetical protein
VGILLPYELIRIWDFSGGCGERASLIQFDCTVATMVMIAVVMNAVTELELRAVRAGSNACRSLLIAIADVALLGGSCGGREREERAERT